MLSYLLNLFKQEVHCCKFLITYFVHFRPNDNVWSYNKNFKIVFFAPIIEIDIAIEYLGSGLVFQFFHFYYLLLSSFNFFNIKIMIVVRSKPLKHETYQFDSFKCPHCNKLFSARSGLKIHGGIAHRKVG